MRIEEVIAEAKAFAQKVFADEQVSQIRLEEVEFDEGEGAWFVTLGLLRPPIVHQTGLSAALADLSLRRSYKTVKIFDDGRGIPSIKIRELHGEG